jgi:hypothetical protein
MKIYRIIKLSNGWSTNKLRREVESLVNEKSREGYDIVTVSFGVNVWWMPTAYITLCQNC